MTRNQNKVAIVILFIRQNIDFKLKTLRKGTTIVNTYAAATGAPKHSKGRKRPKNNSRGSQYPPLEMDRASRQKINKEPLELNHTLEQIDLTDIYSATYIG